MVVRVRAGLGLHGSIEIRVLSETESEVEGATGAPLPRVIKDLAQNISVLPFG